MSEILRSKRELRQKLAARPLAENLRLLDQLRERSLAIVASRAAKASGISAPKVMAEGDETNVGITERCCYVKKGPFAIDRESLTPHPRP